MSREKILLTSSYESIFINPIHPVEDTENIDDVADASLMNVLEMILRYFHTDTKESLEIIKLYLIDIYFILIKKTSRLEKLEYALSVLKDLFSVYTIKNRTIEDIDISDKIIQNKSNPICLLELRIKINNKSFTWYTISYSGIISGRIYNTETVDLDTLKSLDLWDINIDLNLYTFPLMVHRIYLVSLTPLL